MAIAIDESLQLWSDIKDQFHSGGILLGNGSSCAVWEKFNYSSLYKKACHGIEHPLSEENQALFKSMKTENFEGVLAALATAKMVNRLLRQDYSVIEEPYKSIQLALVEAVKQVHIRWQNIENKNILPKIRKELLKYKFVYTTNYDLLIYWAVNIDDHKKVKLKDYFFKIANNNLLFDIADTSVDEKRTKVFYLHGGLHLYKKLSGGTIKRKQENGRNLLDLFGTPLNGEETVPLFVAEGNAEDKLSTIKSSDYLSFAYGEFAKHKGSLVIFGHGLGESDQHILDAIRKAKPGKIAISIRGQTPPEDIKCRKAELQKKLSGSINPKNLIFFDAQTHPLGSPEINVNVN
ncbi:MAG TPA: DUF4917 family protein [Leptolyngbyaceae cyanobacterium]